MLSKFHVFSDQIWTYWIIEQMNWSALQFTLPFNVYCNYISVDVEKKIKIKAGLYHTVCRYYLKLSWWDAAASMWEYLDNWVDFHTRATFSKMSSADVSSWSSTVLTGCLICHLLLGSNIKLNKFWHIPAFALGSTDCFASHFTVWPQLS